MQGSAVSGRQRFVAESDTVPNIISFGDPVLTPGHSLVGPWAACNGRVLVGPGTSTSGRKKNCDGAASRVATISSRDACIPNRKKKLFAVEGLFFVTNEC